MELLASCSIWTFLLVIAFYRFKLMFIIFITHRSIEEPIIHAYIRLAICIDSGRGLHFSTIKSSLIIAIAFEYDTFRIFHHYLIC